MGTLHMVIIDDLEPLESEIVVAFLEDAIDNGDLQLSIKDCISTAIEIKFHQFKRSDDEDESIEDSLICGTCGKSPLDTIHMVEYQESS